MGDFGGFNVEDGQSGKRCWPTFARYAVRLRNHDDGYKALWLHLEETSGARGIDAVLHGPIAKSGR